MMTSMLLGLVFLGEALVLTMGLVYVYQWIALHTLQARVDVPPDYRHNARREP